MSLECRDDVECRCSFGGTANVSTGGGGGQSVGGGGRNDGGLSHIGESY